MSGDWGRGREQSGKEGADGCASIALAFPVSILKHRPLAAVTRPPLSPPAAAHPTPRGASERLSSLLYLRLNGRLDQIKGMVACMQPVSGRGSAWLCVAFRLRAEFKGPCVGGC